MKFKADFTNVSEGGFLPAGEYVCKVTKAELKQGSAAKYINWELTVGVGDQKGSKTYYITSLSVKALFKLREFMIACGLDVPKAVVDIDTDKILGRVVGIKVVPGTYVDKEGNTKNKTEKRYEATVFHFSIIWMQICVLFFKLKILTANFL